MPPTTTQPAETHWNSGHPITGLPRGGDTAVTAWAWAVERLSTKNMRHESWREHDGKLWYYYRTYGQAFLTVRPHWDDDLQRSWWAWDVKHIAGGPNVAHRFGRGCPATARAAMLAAQAAARAAGYRAT
jgi:hypothetical protein